MRTINRSTAFKRDYKRIKATPQHKKDIDSLIEAALVLLLTDQVTLQHRIDWQVEQRIGIGQFHTRSFEVVVVGLWTGLDAVLALATGYDKNAMNPLK